MIFPCPRKIIDLLISTNKLKLDYPCNLKLWLMCFHHYLSIYAKIKLAKKAECHFNFNSNTGI